jgi:amino acid transporter
MAKGRLAMIDIAPVRLRLLAAIARSSVIEKITRLNVGLAGLHLLGHFQTRQSSASPWALTRLAGEGMGAETEFEPEIAAVAVKPKGLQRNAISFLTNVVIGVASTAPAYSLASALGVIAGTAAFGTPAVMIVAFVPMLFIATAYFYLNRADPDCGTTFTWAARAFGPYTGWIGGWALIATNIIVMPSLAVIAGQYTFQLFGESQPSALYVTLAGIAWIVLMTAICYAGIQLSARTQQVLLAVELIVLVMFAAFALAKVYGADPPAASTPVSLGWFNPSSAGGLDKFTAALLVAVFIYWGWDTGVSVNEETENPETAPGHAALVSTVLLVALYALVAVAALAFAGPALLAENKADIFAPTGSAVLGAWPAKLLIVAVLTSASAATQTTILPAARTALSMATAGAIPKRFASIHPRYLSPGFATLVMGAVSIVWFAGLTLLSKTVLDDSILAVGLPIAFYYALTGFACAAYYRRVLLRSLRNFVLMGLVPVTGALLMAFLFVKSCMSLESAPVAIGIGSVLTGFVLMMFARVSAPAFFRQKFDT